MKRGKLLGSVLILAGTLLFIGCDETDKKRATAQPASSEAIGHAECATCGMVVAEQPAPRMQVVHRDQTREFFCSVGDALHYLQAKNALGAPTGIFVEVLPREVDLAASASMEMPWVPVEVAAFVTGVPRKGVMGPPVLAFRSEIDAKAAAERLGGRSATWQQIESNLLSMP